MFEFEESLCETRPSLLCCHVIQELESVFPSKRFAASIDCLEPQLSQLKLFFEK